MTTTPSSTNGGDAMSPLPAERSGAPVDNATTSRTAALREDTADVAGTVKQGVSDVAQEAGEQAREVAGKAKDQARDFVDQASSEVRTRANEQAERAAAGLEQLASRVQALVAGRPEDAGPLRDYAVEAGQRAQRAAEQLRARGADGVLDDMRSFARRRPGAFLAGAAVAGFMVGRLVKAQRANASDPVSSRSPDGSRDGRSQAESTRLQGGGSAVYGAAPATTEVPLVQPYPTPGLEEYPTGVAGVVGAVEGEPRR